MRNAFIVVVNPRGMALMHNFTVETGFALHHLPDNTLPRNTSNREAVGHALNMTPFTDDEEARQVGVWTYRTLFGLRIPFTYRYHGHFGLDSYGGGHYEFHTDGNSRMGITDCDCPLCLDGCI